MKLIISNTQKLRELERLERLEMGALLKRGYISEASKQSYKASSPLLPTVFLPGSLDKIEIMRVRVSLGCSPFHPLDATFCTN